MAHDVFISYSSADKPTADAVCATLEQRGIRCWIAPRDVRPGVEWASAIIDAINASQIMVLVYSGKANESQQIKREVERAVNRGVPLIPFRIEDVPMSKTLEYFISTPHWLDALTGPMQDHLDRLADTAAYILEQAGVTLAAPRAGPSAGTPAPQPMTSSREIVRGIRRWMTGGTESATLAQVFVPRGDRVATVVLIAATVLALAILAQIRVGPIWLQPAALLLAGAVLGSRKGALAAGAYVALGIVGIPVFGGGFSAWTPVDHRAPYAQYMLGYLAGLVVAVYALGWLAERRSWDRRIPTAALLGLVGVALLYVPGLLWVEIVALFQRETRSQQGLLPSLPMLVISVALLAVALPQAWGWVAGHRGDEPGPAPLEPPQAAAEPTGSEPAGAGSGPRT